MSAEHLDPVTQSREHLHEAIQSTAGSNNGTQGAVLVGFVVVAEWLDASEQKLLTAETSRGFGEKPAPDWAWEGWLFRKLFGRLNR